MTEKELREIFRRGECLSLETMRLYHEGKLNSKSAHEVEKHVLECTLCAAAMDGKATKKVIDINKVTANIHRRLGVYMNTPPAPTFMQRFGAMILVASLLVIGGTAGIWYATSSKPFNDTAQQAPQPNTPKSTHTSLHSGASGYNNANGASSATPSSVNEIPETVLTETQQSSGRNNDTSARTSESAPPVVSAVTNTSSIPLNNKPPEETPNTRTLGNQPIRIKSVLIHPPVSHVEGGKRTGGNDGQIGGSNSGSKGLELDEMPTYPGGNEALKKFILANYKAPVLPNGQLKRYSTGFMIQINAKTGAIKSIEQTYPLSPEIDAELMRVMQLLPSWNPGKKRATVDVMIGVTL
jgi:hypothetical protein